jgi:hypothetical protein
MKNQPPVFVLQGSSVLIRETREIKKHTAITTRMTSSAIRKFRGACFLPQIPVLRPRVYFYGKTNGNLAIASI